MIRTEYVEINGRTLIRHESDAGKMIRQIETGIEYPSAVDVMPCKYTYEETEKNIPKYPDTEVIDNET